MDKIRLLEQSRRDIRIQNLKETRDIRRRLVAAQFGLSSPDLRPSSTSTHEGNYQESNQDYEDDYGESTCISSDVVNLYASEEEQL